MLFIIKTNIIHLSSKHLMHLDCRTFLINLSSPEVDGDNDDFEWFWLIDFVDSSEDFAKINIVNNWRIINMLIIYK